MFGLGTTPSRIATVLRDAVGSFLSTYRTNNVTPELVADFNGSLNKGVEGYAAAAAAGGTVDTFAELITHSRAGNATMTDGYGPELVTNGTFDTDSDWTLTNGSITGGEYVGPSSGIQGVQQNSATPLGSKTYLVEFDAYVGSSATTVYLRLGSNLNATSWTIGTALQTYSATVSSGGVTDLIYLLAGAAVNLHLDNISVREVPAIKWAPHNLLTYSQNFVTNWATNTAAVSANAGVAPDGTTTAARVTFSAQYDVIRQQNVLAVSGSKATVGIWIKRESGNTNLSLRASSSANIYMEAITVTDDWQLYTAEFTHDGTNNLGFVLQDRNTSGFGSILVWGAHLFRSDLGGMVDNPDRADSYVPTTSSAVYLPRRNHHVYNGDDWVNEGVLHESEARANLFANSVDLTSGGELRSSTANNAAVSPTGKIDAGSLIEDNTAAASHLTQFNYTTDATAHNYCFSVWLKANTRSKVKIEEGTTSDNFILVDLSNGSVNSVGSSVSQYAVEDWGSGWYRVFVGININTNIYRGRIYLLDDSYNQSYDGDGSSGIYLFGPQLEIDTLTPSSYVPTSGSTVTRAAETLTIPAANMPWPEPNYIGPELVVNGGFSSGTTDWTVRNSSNATIAEVSGQLVTTVVSSGANGVYQEIPTVVGKVYTLSSLLVSKTALNVRIRVGTSIGGTQYDTLSPSSNGQTSTLTFKATSTSLFYELGYDSNPTAGDTFVWDNISVREIDPLAVSIQMQGRVTYADTGGDDRFVQWGNLMGEEIRENLVYGGSQIGTIQSLQRFDGVVDVATILDAYQPGVFVPFNFASRHGSTFVNTAADGVSATVNTTPTALPDLSTSDFNLGYDYMGTISMLRVWADDLADAGIAEASEPSEVPSLQLTFDNSQTSFTIQDWEQ